MMKEIEGYDGNYKINESGIIINKKGHVMRSAESNSGYLRTALETYNDDGSLKKRKNESIHRLVAKTFIPNPNNLPVVMHLDNDKLNNHVSNLKWGTQSENMQQAYTDGRKFSPCTGSSQSKYQIFDNTTGDIITCNNRSEVSDLIGYSLISLKNMIGNGRKISLGPYKGYQIRRVQDMIKIINK